MADYALTYVELDLPRCARTYGDGDCKAEIGVTGETKCFNCPSTCQDVENYLEETQIVRFVKNSQHIPSQEIEAFNCIGSLRIDGQAIFPGENLGKRERGELILHNFADGDEYFDKYIDHRMNVDGYIPYFNGTFLGRLYARYQNMEGFQIRVYNGKFVKESNNKMEQLEVKHYIIDKTTYQNDSLKIEFTDVLKFFEQGKFLFPKPSDGQLATSITDTGGSFSLKPSGVGDSYPASGYASIGKEIVSFTRTGDSINLTGRGLFFTEAKSHSADDTFQVCVQLNGTMAEILSDLFDATDTPTEYKDYESWELECAAYNTRIYSALIAEPTDINKLITDLMQDGGLQIQSDVVNKKLKMKFLRNAMPTFELTNDNCYDIETSSDSSKRISGIYTLYGRMNPLEKSDVSSNYSGKLFRPDTDPRNLLQKNMPKLRTRYSRFIQPTGRQASSIINELMLSRYNKPLRKVSCKTALEHAPQLGDIGIVRFVEFEDYSGRMAKNIPMQVVKRNYDFPEVELDLEEYSVNYINDTNATRIVSITQNYMMLNLRQLHNAEWGDSEIPENTEVIFESDPGVVLGQLTHFGEWPEILEKNVTVKIKNARIVGMGGKGGTSGSPNGGRGGNAFHTRYPVELIDCYVAGGGGGGGGVKLLVPDYRFFIGGGGAGVPAGSGSPPGGPQYGGSSINSGNGGHLGMYGESGAVYGPTQGFPGGPPGYSIDGYSYCTLTNCTVLAPWIN